MNCWFWPLWGSFQDWFRVATPLALAVALILRIWLRQRGCSAHAEVPPAGFAAFDLLPRACLHGPTRVTVAWTVSRGPNACLHTQQNSTRYTISSIGPIVKPDTESPNPGVQCSPSNSRRVGKRTGQRRRELRHGQQHGKSSEQT